MKKIGVMVADDHAILRAGLRLLINTQADMQTLAEAGDFPEALHLTRTIQPDVLILDLSMPGGNGIQMIELLLQERTTTRILVLTMHDDPGYLRAALAGGASGYVAKKAADSELFSAIRAVSQGRIFVDMEMSSTTSSQSFPSDKTDAANSASCLSEREREVLELLVQGHTNQTVADHLFLSVKTVESYRARLLQKLGLTSRADLVRYARQVGLFENIKPAPWQKNSNVP